MARLTGTQLGRYHIGELLGHGGFAAVYQARDEGLDTDVAVKVLADIHSFDPESRERFLAEGRLLRRVRHPNIVQVHDIGETLDGQPYLVLQLGRRGSLADRVPDVAPDDGLLAAPSKRNSPPVDGEPTVDITDLRLVADTLTGALGALHDSGIVHRDITPANLFITTKEETQRASVASPGAGRIFAADEALLVGDLGLAKDLSQGSGLTVGAGTRRYSAPEQQQAYGTITPATDVFSASRVMTELAAFSPLSGEITQAMSGGLNPEPAERPASMQEWRALLEPVLSPVGSETDGDGAEVVESVVATDARSAQGIEAQPQVVELTTTDAVTKPNGRGVQRGLLIGLMMLVAAIGGGAILLLTSGTGKEGQVADEAVDLITSSTGEPTTTSAENEEASGSTTTTSTTSTAEAATTTETPESDSGVDANPGSTIPSTTPSTTDDEPTEPPATVGTSPPTTSSTTAAATATTTQPAPTTTATATTTTTAAPTTTTVAEQSDTATSVRAAMVRNGKTLYDGSAVVPGWSNLSWGSFDAATFAPSSGQVQLGQFAAASIGASQSAENDWIDVSTGDWIVVVVSDLTPALAPQSAFQIRATKASAAAGTPCALSGTDFAQTDEASGETLIAVPASLLLPDGGPISRVSVMSSGSFTELRFRLVLAGTVPELTNPPASRACGQ